MIQRQFVPSLGFPPIHRKDEATHLIPLYKVLLHLS